MYDSPAPPPHPGSAASADHAGPRAEQPTGEPPYEIRIDCERHMLEMVLRGQWDERIFAAFAVDYRQATATMNANGGIAYSLVDTGAYGELTPELVALFPPLIAESNPSPDRRTAMVSAKLINRAQSRDAVGPLNPRHFRDVESAREWLFGDEA